MTSSHKRIALVLLVAGLWTTIGTSCNTFRGVGRDVQHVGGHIESAAR